MNLREEDREETTEEDTEVTTEEKTEILGMTEEIGRELTGEREAIRGIEEEEMIAEERIIEEMIGGTATRQGGKIVLIGGKAKGPKEEKETM
jgi:hypothetical protein